MMWNVALRDRCLLLCLLHLLLRVGGGAVVFARRRGLRRRAARVRMPVAFAVVGGGVGAACCQCGARAANARLTCNKRIAATA